VPIVAVDVPSGVNVTDRQRPARQAAVTVTFGTHKVAHLVDPAARLQAVHLVDIGLDLPDAPSPLQADDVARMRTPDAAAHRSTPGTRGCRAGSEQYPGAGVLCTAGASSGFAGMVRYEGEAADAVRQAHPEVVAGPGQVQAWVVGSGGGTGAGAALKRSLEDRVPLVVDADALAHLAGPIDVPALLTPHAGELARMLGVERGDVEAEQLRFAREAAARYDAVVLLKGRHTLVAAPDRAVRVNTVGVPWLATAGW
jgi:NAD(P)H-hydrate repair Nnr-like enzyme with NAD(P)H-hydrate dehydratase domain